MAGSNFVDYVKIYCRSGNGGPGSTHLRREKFIPKGGPDGGDGGRGGHIILRGNSQMWTLLHLRYKRHIFAENGGPGGQQLSTGADGKDIVIEVPLGTIAKQESTGADSETTTSSLPRTRHPDTPSRVNRESKKHLFWNLKYWLM